MNRSNLIVLRQCRFFVGRVLNKPPAVENIALAKRGYSHRIFSSRMSLKEQNELFAQLKKLTGQMMGMKAEIDHLESKLNHMVHSSGTQALVTTEAAELNMVTSEFLNVAMSIKRDSTVSEITELVLQGIKNASSLYPIPVLEEHFKMLKLELRDSDLFKSNFVQSKESDTEIDPRIWDLFERDSQLFRNDLAEESNQSTIDPRLWHLFAQAISPDFEDFTNDNQGVKYDALFGNVLDLMDELSCGGKNGRSICFVRNVKELPVAKQKLQDCPDTVVYSMCDHVMLACGEESTGGWDSTGVSKLASEANLPCIFAYHASDTSFLLYLIGNDGVFYKVSQLNLSKVHDRISLILQAINVYRVMRGLVTLIEENDEENKTAKATAKGPVFTN